MVRRLGEADRLGLIHGRLGESAELGEAHTSQERSQTDGGAPIPKYS